MAGPARLAKKDKLRIIIHTKDYVISGEVYLFEDSRLSDILNSETDKMYLAMTDVVMTNSNNGNEEKKQFILVNKNSIEILYLDDISKDAALTFTILAKNALNKLNFDQAINEARKALSIDSTNAESHYILAMALGKKQNLSEAFKEFELAAKYAGENSKIGMLASDMINQIKI